MNGSTPFLPQEVIIAKRNGEELDSAVIKQFVDGINDRSIADAQVGAMAMAIFLQGMTTREVADLTLSMRDSGTKIDWSQYGFDKDAPIVDKHSTGGVGDKVSLMLAPIVAAAGAHVPMISGRGLGHSGGTLDKLESIPGYNPFPTVDRFAEITREIGCSIIGQTGELAPADKRLYGIRDVTGTVESVPLITASILSKKLAAGLNALVMDVKCGNGAFMQTPERAEELARSIARVAKAADTPAASLITDMSEVLGRTAGNAVEIYETIEFLTAPAKADKRLLDVTIALAAHMLHLAGIVSSADEGEKKAQEVLNNGKATEVFAKMVVAQGGPTDLMEKPDTYLKLAPVRRDILVKDAGIVTAVDTRRVGMLVVAQGGGRTDPSQKVDHSVGLTDFVGRGRKLAVGDKVATVYATDEAQADYAEREVLASLEIGDGVEGITPVIHKVITD